MNTDVQRPLDLELYSGHAKKGIRVKKRRFIIGSSQTCDLVVNSQAVNAIHAVLEVNTDGTINIYDMNSRSGTFVNGNKAIMSPLNVGDKISLGNIEFELRQFNKIDIPAAPLQMLEDIKPIDELPKMGMPQRPEAVIAKNVNEAAVAPTPILPGTKTKELPVRPTGVSEKTGMVTPAVSVVYPLAKDPRAEFSEYIFEDVETLYPIFHYDVSYSAIEVLILFQGEILSVDYLPIKDGIYHLKGWNARNNEIEYPYLGKEEKIPFVDIKGSEVLVSPIPGYDMLSLTDSGRSSNVSGTVVLGGDDILRFSKGDLQVFVRSTDAPPRVDAAPILRRDGSLKKILLLVLLFIFLFLGSMQLFTVDKELEKEKAPERIATILYKPKKLVVSKNPAIDKTEKAPKVNQKSPVQKREEKQEVKKIETAEKTEKSAQPKGDQTAKTTDPVKKASPNKGPTNNKTTRVAPQKSKAGGASKSVSTANSQKVDTKSQGAVDTYKSIDFKSSLSSLMAKGGSTKSFEPSVRGGSGDSSASSTFQGGESMTAETAQVSNEVGDFKGVATGKVDRSKGISGIVDKKNIATAGLPYRTVVLGSMDPDIIRRLIEAHASEFRYCYQKELEKSPKSFDGLIRLDFVIGASGHVTKVSATADDAKMPSEVRSCVANVLRGIKFPEPRGGGSVSVNQPMNFYPRNL